MYRYEILKKEISSQNSDHLVFHMPDGIKLDYHQSQPDCASHSHEYIEFFYILSGRIEHTLNGNTSVLTEGDFALIDRESYHCFKKIGNESCSLMNIIFYPSFIDRSLSEKDNFKDILCSRELHYGKHLPADTDINRVYHETENTIKNLILNMQQEFFFGEFGHLKILKMQLITLLIHVLRYMLKNSTSEETGTSIDFAIEYINRNYNQKISLTELSNIMHYTPQHLCSKFKKTTGFSFSEYMQKVRIEHSCRLLQHTNMKITEIANAVGYSDIKHFEITFKKHTDRSPSGYRRFWKKQNS